MMIYFTSHPHRPCRPLSNNVRKPASTQMQKCYWGYNGTCWSSDNALNTLRIPWNNLHFNQMEISQAISPKILFLRFIPLACCQYSLALPQLPFSHLHVTPSGFTWFQLDSWKALHLLYIFETNLKIDISTLKLHRCYVGIQWNCFIQW